MATYDIAEIAKAQYKVVIPEVGVVLHNVHHHRLVADWNHRFWDRVINTADSSSLTTTKNDDRWEVGGRSHTFRKSGQFSVYCVVICGELVQLSKCRARGS